MHVIGAQACAEIDATALVRTWATHTEPSAPHARYDATIVFYQGSGASDFSIGPPVEPPEVWQKIKSLTIRLLTKRHCSVAAHLLDKFPFEVREGTNFFGDEFRVLYCEAALEDYVEAEGYRTATYRSDFQVIANTLAETSPHYIRFIAVGLRTDDRSEPVAAPILANSSALVEQALHDAEVLMLSRGAVSAVDRAHTAFHAFLKAICHKASIALNNDAGITEIFAAIRRSHPALASSGPHSESVSKMLRSLGTIVDTVNYLRNRGSVAHPNEQLLDEPEAMLVINSIRTLLHYLDLRIGKQGGGV
jgi:hypothetical protein